MREYTFREGLLDTVTTSMRSVEVRSADGGDVIGNVVRGELEGCERAGTFRFEPRSDPSTSMGIRRGTGLEMVNRLLRPQYRMVHGGRESTFKDRPGENLLYFAVRGTVDGRRIDARADWDSSIEITADSTEIGRFDPGELLMDTRVQVTSAEPGSAVFGLLMVLPFIYRIYEQESELIESLFDV